MRESKAFMDVGLRANVGSYESPVEIDDLPVQDHAAEWVRLAREAFTASDGYFTSSIRNDVIRDLRQFQSLHPDNSKYLKPAWAAKSDMFRPKTRAMIRKGEAQAATAFFGTQDVVSILPRDGENEQSRAAALVFQALTQHYLTIQGQRWFQKLVGGYQATQVHGIVISYQSWIRDGQRGIDRPDVRLVPIENFRFDPGADWTNPAETSPYLIELLPMRAGEIKARVEEGKWLPVTDADLAKSATVADTIRLAREQRREDRYDVGTEITAYSIVWVHRNIVMLDGLDVEFYTLGTEKLLSEPKPVVEVYPHGRPYVVGTCMVDTFKAYPDSPIKLTRGIQAEINELANLRLENIKLVLNKRYIVRRNRDVDLQSLTRNVAGSVTLATDAGDVQTLQTGDVTSSSFAEADRLNVEMDDLGGAFSGSSVASNRKLNETATGMNLLSTSATQVGEYQLRTFVETWVEPMLYQIVELIRAYCSDPVLLALVGNSKGLRDMGFTGIPEELFQQEVVVTVNVGVGAVNPTAKVERFTFALGTVLKAYPQLQGRLKPEEIVKELFGCLGYKDAGRFFDFSVEADPLQKALAELEVGLKQAQLAKIQADTASKNVEALYSAMQTGATAIQIPGVTAVADAIAKSAGFVDQDAPPIYPQAPMPGFPEQTMPVLPQNTHPLYPANPDRGMMQGIEGGGQ